MPRMSSNGRTGDSRITSWIAARRDDFLPLSLTAASVVISLAAIWVGLARDAPNFVLNILATAALLGPGAVLSNVLVTRFESIRKREEAEKRVKSLLMLGHGIFGQFVGLADDFLSLLSAAMKEADLSVGGYEPLAVPNTYPELRQVLSDAVAIVTGLIESPPEAVPSVLPLPDRALSFPDVRLLVRIIEMIDREMPMPLHVLGVHGLLSYTQDVGIDFIDEYPNMSILRAPGDDVRRVIESRVGFADIANFTHPSVRGSAKRHITTESYAACVLRTVRQADMLLKFLLAEIPEDVLPDVTELVDRQV